MLPGSGSSVNKGLKICAILQLMEFIVHGYAFLVFSGGYLADDKYASPRPWARE